MPAYYLHAGCSNKTGKDSKGYWSNREIPTCSGCGQKFRATGKPGNFSFDPNVTPPQSQSGAVPKVADPSVATAGPSELARQVAMLLGHVGEVTATTPVTATVVGASPQAATSMPLPMMQSQSGPVTELNDQPGSDRSDDDKKIDELRTKIEGDLEKISASIKTIESVRADASKAIADRDAVRQELDRIQQGPISDAVLALNPLWTRALKAGIAASNAARDAVAAAVKEVSAPAEAAVERFETEVGGAFNFKLDVAFLKHRAEELYATCAAARHSDSVMPPETRIETLKTVRQQAEQGLADYRRLTQPAGTAVDALKELKVLIDAIHQDRRGPAAAEPVAVYSDLLARQTVAGKLTDIDKYVEVLEGIARDALDALSKGRAAFDKEPVAAAICKLVDDPFKKVRQDIAALAKIGVRTDDIESQVRGIQTSLADAQKLESVDQAVAAAKEIARRLADVQRELDAEAADPDLGEELEEAIKAVVRRINTALDTAEDAVLDTAALRTISEKIGARLSEARDIEDAKQRFDALNRIKRDADETLERAEALADAADDVTHGTTGDLTTADEAKIYQAALETLYGLKIEIPPGFKTANLDMVFDMFAMVPKEFVVQPMLKKLKYDETKSGGGAYDYLYAAITMEKFGDRDEENPYVVDGIETPLNAFKVTTLHEIGHSVDELHAIMDAEMGGGDAGWEKHSTDEVVAVFAAELRKVVKVGKEVDNSVLMQAVGPALKSGDVKQPEGLSAAYWSKAKGFLDDRCLPLRAGEEPWYEGGENLAVDGRVYQEAKSGEWYSYLAASRGATRVSDYQWRSPGEWFSELFAVSWFTRKPPPSGVSAGVAKYMWRPDVAA